MTFAKDYYIAEIMTNKGTEFVDTSGYVTSAIEVNCFHAYLAHLRHIVNELKDKEEMYRDCDVVYKKVKCNYVW